MFSHHSSFQVVAVLEVLDLVEPGEEEGDNPNVVFSSWAVRLPQYRHTAEPAVSFAVSYNYHWIHIVRTLLYYAPGVLGNFNGALRVLSDVGLPCSFWVYRCVLHSLWRIIQFFEADRPMKPFDGPWQQAILKML
ncbi:hypothetical protein PAXRUDRAFT_463110 [Paxillus rubicundulus Ve08.2h10]|uniref:Uncharacterized protein n=1 Tax=Paxillus rubicundulus Ve08.2h10 TaxID=930991 RepID=A0A0D0E6W1_9AGAM|nr:hypothetical protein PAXRUDRAFT_463110 [Paxillus rubicundulus Ve08.2h10]